MTSKYQARRRPERSGSVQVCSTDTPTFLAQLHPVKKMTSRALGRLSPTRAPTPGEVLELATLHSKLLRLVGREFPHSPSERRRGEQLHRAVCEVLGLATYADSGQFPDVACQALQLRLPASFLEAK